MTQEARMVISTEDNNVERLRALCLRWNKAASAAGVCGSEFVDDPERVFKRIAEHERFHVRLAYRKGTLGLALRDDDGEGA